MRTKKIMLFGVFDNLHHGHHHLLSEASDLCDELIVVVAPDESVKRLKSNTPQQSLSERIDAIKKSNKASHVVPGDDIHGSWNVITTHEPNCIAIGHDQFVLREALEEHCSRLPFPITFVTIDKLDY